MHVQLQNTCSTHHAYSACISDSTLSVMYSKSFNFTDGLLATLCGNNYRRKESEGRGPGIHCLRMRENTPGFCGCSYNSVPYRRLYPWTVRDRPFYCLGVVLRIWLVVASFLPLSPTLFLKLENKDWC